MMVYEEIRLVKPALELKDKALEYRSETAAIISPKGQCRFNKNNREKRWKLLQELYF